MIGLTPKLRQCLDYIRAYSEANGGVSPSYDEIAAAMQVRSRSGVHRMIAELKVRGHVRALAGRPRSVEVVECRCPHCGHSILAAPGGTAPDARAA